MEWIQLKLSDRGIIEVTSAWFINCMSLCPTIICLSFESTLTKCALMLFQMLVKLCQFSVILCCPQKFGSSAFYCLLWNYFVMHSFTFRMSDRVLFCLLNCKIFSTSIHKVRWSIVFNQNFVLPSKCTWKLKELVIEMCTTKEIGLKFVKHILMFAFQISRLLPTESFFVQK